MAEEGSKTQATTATDLGPVSVVTTAQLKALVRDTQLAMWATAPKEHLRKLGLSDAQLVAALREAGLPVVLETPSLQQALLYGQRLRAHNDQGPDLEDPEAANEWVEALRSIAGETAGAVSFWARSPQGQAWKPGPTTSLASASSTGSTATGSHAQVDAGGSVIHLASVECGDRRSR